MYQRILIATDGSPLSKKAVGSAVGLAAGLGASLVALYVVPRYAASYFEGAVTMSVQEVGRIEQLWTDKGQTVIDAVQRLARTRGVETKGVLAHSDLVAEAVIAAARKNRCDLIVMASHGRKGIKRLLLGSETQHVLTHSTVPVLVLR